MFCADARRSSAALPNEKARRKRDFMPLAPSLSFRALSCCTAALPGTFGLAGLGGSNGAIGLESGEGVMTRLEVSGVPRDEGDEEPVFGSFRDWEWLALRTFLLEAIVRTEGLAELTDEVLPTLPCLSWSWLEFGRLWRPGLDTGLISWDGCCTGGVVGEGVPKSMGSILAD